jgi:hypothetical protein
MSGSSGCIDIGGDFSRLADWLEGFPQLVEVTVRYEHPAPSVEVFTGFSGMLAYQRATFGIAPQLSLGFETSGGGGRFVLAPQIDAVMQWAGGALSAGIRLDIPMNDREQFIRLGLLGGADFRLFGPLFGQIRGGYAFALTPRAADPGAEMRPDASRTSGPLIGTGLQYDFGRVQLGALYDYLHTANNADPNVHQAFVRLGLTF